MVRPLTYEEISSDKLCSYCIETNSNTCEGSHCGDAYDKYLDDFYDGQEEY